MAPTAAPAGDVTLTNMVTLCPGLSVKVVDVETAWSAASSTPFKLVSWNSTELQPLWLSEVIGVLKVMASATLPLLVRLCVYTTEPPGKIWFDPLGVKVTL